MKRKGFTLIELLVVIMIIAILAAILFPVFARVREKARQAACASNARQLGIAFRMYLDDFNNIFPCINNPQASSIGDNLGYLYEGRNGPWDAASVDYVNNFSFFAQLQPYLKSNKVRICPSDRGRGEVSAEPTAGKYYSSYAYRFFIGLTLTPTCISDNDPQRHPGQTFKMKWLKDPSKTFVIHEVKYDKGGNEYLFHHSSPFFVPLPGGGGITDRNCALNVVYADCHAKFTKLGELMIGFPANDYFDYNWWNSHIPNNSGLDIPGFLDIP